MKYFPGTVTSLCVRVCVSHLLTSANDAQHLHGDALCFYDTLKFEAACFTYNLVHFLLKQDTIKQCKKRLVKNLNRIQHIHMAAICLARVSLKGSSSIITRITLLLQVGNQIIWINQKYHTLSWLLNN